MATRSRRLSQQTIDVLAALAEKRGGWLYGLQIAAATDLKSGSLYPILIRLDERGLLESKWIDSEHQGRPARHAYRITGAGRAAHSEALTTATDLRGAPA